MILSGLPGLKADHVSAVTVRSPRAARVALRFADAITAANANGSITAWKVEGGGFRAQFHRYLCTKADATFPNVTRLENWLREQWPNMLHSTGTERA
jgi:hypothetical protein